MSERDLLRLGGATGMLAGLLMATRGVLLLLSVAFTPAGTWLGLGTVALVILALLATYGAQMASVGVLGLSGLALATLGGVLIAIPLWLLMADVSGVEGARSLVGFSQGLFRVSLVFWLGILLLGIASARGAVVSRAAGAVLALGALLALLGSWFEVASAETGGILVVGLGLGWMGGKLWWEESKGRSGS